MSVALPILEAIGRGYLVVCGALMFLLLACLAWTNRGRARRWLRTTASEVQLFAAGLVLALLSQFVDEDREPCCHSCLKPLDPTIAVGRGAWYCGPCARARAWARCYYARLEGKAQR